MEAETYTTTYVKSLFPEVSLRTIQVCFELGCFGKGEQKIGRGHRREFSFSDIVVLAIMVQMAKMGISYKTFAEMKCLNDGWEASSGQNGHIYFFVPMNKMMHFVLDETLLIEDLMERVIKKQQESKAFSGWKFWHDQPGGLLDLIAAMERKKEKQSHETSNQDHPGNRAYR